MRCCAGDSCRVRDAAGAGSGEAPARLSPALLEGGPGARHDHLEPPVAPVAQRSAAALGGCLRRCVESAA